MRKGLLGSLTALLAGAGLAYAEPPLAMPPALAPGAPAKPMPAPASPAPANPMIVDGTPGVLGDHDVVADHGDGGPSNRIWGSAEYLYWWTKSANLPALVTTSPVIPLGTAGAPGGALGGPGTTVLLGNSGFNDEGLNGGRFTLGWWLDDCHSWGLEGSYFFLGRRTERDTIASPGTALITRPFFDITIPGPSVEIVSLPSPLPGAAALGLPPALAGGVTVSESVRLNGYEINAVKGCINTCNLSLSLLAGFRELELEDRLQIQENITVLPGIALIPGFPTFPFVPGNTITVTDRFDTRNFFYGGQVGACAEVRSGKWFADITTKVALGETREIVGISGGTTIVSPAGTLSLPGGLLALSTNSGRYSRDQFAVVPEFDLNIGYQVRDNVRVFVGYTFLYWDKVVRPGDQINLAVNPTFVPTALPFGAVVPAGPAEPHFSFRTTDFWAQGISFGLEFRF
jgi:hypothetical protein